MILKDLLKDIYLKPLPRACEGLVIETISCDSRLRQPQGLFVALDGFQFKGEDFIQQAIVQGAVVVAKKGSSRTLSNYTIADSVCLLDVEDPKLFLRQITLRFFDSPSRKVRTIGVTGTNGKTTITYLLESILQAKSKACAVIGTVNYRLAGQTLPSKNTTPGFLENQSYLAHLASLKIPYCVMEVSSHALKQGRVDGIDFACAIFTNLTQDHLDYHKDMESYFKAKAILFENLSDYTSVVINQDDPYGGRLMRLFKGEVITYGIKTASDVKAVGIKSSLNGTQMDIVFPTGKMAINTRFIGEHNVYNILAACACAWREGIDLDRIRQGVEALSCVPGRLEPVDAGQDYFVFIDYAHTEDGLVNVLKSLRTVSRNKIILVFGCGGDRDRGKRPQMGRAACTLADYAIVTSDNPRSEDPMAIIDEIKAGFTRPNYEVIVDRKKAIARALEMAGAGQIVLIAGKGHEDCQILKDRTIEFNERKIIQELLKTAS
ncbi:MAG: UDP-N-acetylmuramoyl-L-alanyl-D-glutamate--2,6-diaminopimelate ligase [Candidatus Omnitrophica bacterium]|nr:UDP-N-acetylmuramoyl-L-alanyl-D-glutamate--2,6-diaminopimelate ligase [Candidatus Omnitrophota bacterium]